MSQTLNRIITFLPRKRKKPKVTPQIEQATAAPGEIRNVKRG